VPVELKREDIVVERVPAHEVEAGKGTFQEEVIKVPLSREEPVVEKEVHVTGGVRVSGTFRLLLNSYSPFFCNAPMRFLLSLFVAAILGSESCFEQTPRLARAHTLSA
jgi:hypothetical protein